MHARSAPGLPLPSRRSAPCHVPLCALLCRLGHHRLPIGPGRDSRFGRRKRSAASPQPAVNPVRPAVRLPAVIAYRPVSKPPSSPPRASNTAPARAQRISPLPLHTHAHPACTPLHDSLPGSPSQTFPIAVLPAPLNLHSPPYPPLSPCNAALVPTAPAHIGLPLPSPLPITFAQSIDLPVRARPQSPGRCACPNALQTCELLRLEGAENRGREWGEAGLRSMHCSSAPPVARSAALSHLGAALFCSAQPHPCDSRSTAQPP